MTTLDDKLKDFLNSLPEKEFKWKIQFVVDHSQSEDKLKKELENITEAKKKWWKNHSWKWFVEISKINTVLDDQLSPDKKAIISLIEDIVSAKKAGDSESEAIAYRELVWDQYHEKPHALSQDDTLWELLRTAIELDPQNGKLLFDYVGLWYQYHFIPEPDLFMLKCCFFYCLIVADEEEQEESDMKIEYFSKLSEHEYFSGSNYSDIENKLDSYSGNVFYFAQILLKALVVSTENRNKYSNKYRELLNYHWTNIQNIIPSWIDLITGSRPKLLELWGHTPTAKTNVHAFDRFNSKPIILESYKCKNMMLAQHNSTYLKEKVEEAKPPLVCKWAFHNLDSLINPNPIVKDSLLIFSTQSGCIYALDKISGKKIWSFKSHGKVYSSPSANSDLICFACSRGNVYVLKAQTGELLWTINDTSGCTYSEYYVALLENWILFSRGELYKINVKTGDAFSIKNIDSQDAGKKCIDSKWSCLCWLL